MKIILLSGGSGKRLWPLSNNARSKQFIQLLPSVNGSIESMVQRVVRQMSEADLNCDVTIATSAGQRGVIEAQLGDGVDIVTEPERRDTFPAIALSTAYLALEKGCNDDEVVVVMPCDPFTDGGYFKTISRMAAAVEAQTADLVLMGICPTYASSKFGYVVPQQGEAGKSIMRVKGFTEKPTEERAAELIKAGALWNGGVFAFRLGYMRAITAKYVQAASFDEMYNRYGELPKISFDYEVAEKAQSIAVLPFNGTWCDLGTWNAFARELSGQCIGNAIIDNPDDGSQVVNQLGLPLLCIGTANLIVAASADGILVADKEHCEQLKTFVDKLPQEPRYEEFGWGCSQIIDLSDAATTSRVTIKNGASISTSTNLHERILNVISGNGSITINESTIPLSKGTSVTVPQDCSYEINATAQLQLIEVKLA